MKLNSGLSNFLDLSRWLAAFEVVVSHLRSLLLVDYESLENKTIFIKTFYFLTNFGHQAVIVFFVLSGFLIGGSIITRVKKKNFSFLQYTIDRFSRIYIVFPLSLVIGALLDFLGNCYFNKTGLYTNQIELLTIHFNISERIGNVLFLSNFFMLQTLVTPPLGSNSPLWSLANEWWYYFYFPLILMLFTQHKLFKKAICIAFLIALSVLMCNSSEHGNML